ncbi:MAG: glycosyltransferase family 2 protein [Acutalibacteraceae bacterium]
METSKPIISILVPIYNVEKYLDRCLKSIQNQSFTDFEVIMINDGSQDNSGKIARKYAEEDKRFILVNQENIGMSKSRNKAYSMSRGDYISLIDSDDYVAPDFLAEMYSAAKKSGADVTVCNYALNFEPECRIKKKKSRNLPAGEFTRDEAIQLLLKDRQLRFYVWNKLWKKDFLEKTGAKFIDIFYEDIVFCTQNFMHINKLCSIDYIGNFYSRQTKTILEKTMSFKRIDDYISTVGYMRGFLEQAGCFKQFRSCFRVHANHVRFSIPILVIQANHSAKQKVKVFHTIIKNLKRLSYYTGKKFCLETLKSQEGEKKCQTTTHLQ